MSDEDDLPVLTQVLVTASGRAPAGMARGAREPASDATADGRTEPPLQRLLVIGNDPDEVASPTVGLPLDPVADPRRPVLRDVFSHTVPNGEDHADPHAASPDPRSGAADAQPHAADPEHPWFIDEPPIERFAPGGSSTAGGADAFSATPPVVAASFTDRPLLASAGPDGLLAGTVRDEVLERLAARIDTELDARIAHTIRVELDSALAQLQARLRVELSEALRDVVGRAVEEAIARRADSSDAGMR